MATVNGKTVAAQHAVLQTTWTPLGDADSGSTEQLSRYPNKSVTFNGTFGAATAVLEGSDDGVTFFTINDVKGNAVSTTSAARFDIVDVPYYIRPRTSGGSGSAVTVTLTSRSFGH